MSPWKPIPSSDQADLTGSTGTPRSTRERRGRSHRLSSWLMLKRPSGTSIMPARKRSQSARANCIQACSSETFGLVAALDRLREAALAPFDGLASLDLQLGQALELDLDDAAQALGDGRVTGEHEAAERERVAELVEVVRLEPRRAVAPELEIAEPGRARYQRRGCRDGWHLRHPLYRGRERRGGLSHRGLGLILCSSCFLRSFTCSCSAFSFCSISSADAAQARPGQDTACVTTRNTTRTQCRERR